ncbi:Rne/Rng family ribonuclease [Aeromicrobium sp.]|uniref:Rne/Rng family ribonuclease n=1 Tax=Aeromicrobium sp. TaxID=1871063 RepID=UPI0019B11A57|nr:Rne/Rng family ribonuclease [Aeromicrobium sp.]MBC7630727.1 Rne/Rng family ribonuclease [Aeromicrobium sp.]
MLDDNDTPTDAPNDDKPTRRRAAGRPAGPPAAVSFSSPAAAPAVARAKPADKPDGVEPLAASGKAAPARRSAKKAAAKPTDETVATDDEASPAPRKTAAKKAAKKSPKKATPDSADVRSDSADEPDQGGTAPGNTAPVSAAPANVATAAMFKAPESRMAPARPKPEREDRSDDGRDDSDDNDGDDDDPDAPKRRRRSRGGRRRRKGEGDADVDGDGDDGSGDDSDGDDDTDANGNTRRRRRRARAGEGADASPDDPQNTVVRVRSGRSAEDEITGVAGSTRLEAKKQRRREGREAGRRRAPIVSEAEFLARRESVKREMVVRQRDDYTQIAVLEDNVLVEHYVARESQISIIGNVYLGKVQNVLPSMEAAFVDIGAGRNAVLYAGEVDWTTLGNGKQRKIEDALKPGQTILVQVSKDPIGQKGARLTSQVSLPGRFLVLVPGGQTSGISRKLPENERARLKALLKEVLPDEVGVIVRTAAEGATEDQLTRDVTALTARWEDIERKVAAGKSPDLLYSEPDLMIKVVRDLFNEDFNKLIVEGDDSWDMIKGYVDHVAPDLAERVTRWDDDAVDAFTSYRLDEQIHKALDRKVFLPSGGSLVIDRTEAMTVVDVNTGKYTGSGGNLEETVTKNNLEAAEEVVRQLRLRDIGGIIVVDFIDMVLESNRDLVLRRLVECLGRDRTRHQVAEVTSLGLIQMTRKRIGTGLLESFSVECDHCNGRGIVIQDAPVEPKKDEQRRGGRGGRGGNGTGNGNGNKRNAGAGKNADGGARSDEESAAVPDAGAVSETKPVDPKPVEPKPVEPVPVEPKPVEPVPVEPKPVESIPVEVKAPAPAKKATRKRGSASKPAGPPAPVPDASQRPVESAPGADAQVDPPKSGDSSPTTSTDPGAGSGKPSGDGDDTPVLTSEGQAP